MRLAIFELRPNFETECPHNDLDMLKVKVPIMHTTGSYIPNAQIFIPFILQSAIIELRPNFEKVSQMSSKWPWHVGVQKYRPICLHAPPMPKFCLFHFIMFMRRRFRVTAQFWEKYTECPQNDLDMFKVKNSHIHTTTIHPWLTPSVLFYGEPFSTWENCTKCPPNNLNMFKFKSAHIHSAYTHCSFRSTMSCFGSNQDFWIPQRIQCKYFFLFLITFIKLKISTPQNERFNHHEQSQMFGCQNIITVRRRNRVLKLSS